MIQFLGLHLGLERAAAAVLGRDLAIWARAVTPIVNATRDAAGGVAEVPSAEWIRGGSYVLQEAYFQLPVAARKVWGLGLAGPSGWIALDREFEPLSPLRLTGELSVEEDTRRWLAANPRAERRISVILSPKDYFRFALSGGLAADVTTASRLGLLVDEASHWSEPRVRKNGLRLDWLPPVFDSHVPTGRLSAEGMRRTSLPGGFWLVAGAHEVEAALVAAGDLRQSKLWVLARPGAPSLLAYGVAGLQPAAELPGWQRFRSGMAGHQVLERSLEGPPEKAPGGEEPMVMACRRELEAAGYPVVGVEQAQGAPELGAAILAAIGSGLVKSWDRYYRERPPWEDETPAQPSWEDETPAQPYWEGEPPPAPAGA